MELFYNLLINMKLDSLEEIFEALSDGNKRQLLYGYFYNDKKVEEVCRYIIMEKQGKNDENFKVFIKNLILMYPLSKKLIFALNKYEVKLDNKNIPTFLNNSSYVEGFYVALKKEFEELYETSRRNPIIKHLGEAIEQYEREKDELVVQIEELTKKSTPKAKELKKEVEKLREEKENVEKESNPELLEEEIKVLKEEIEARKKDIQAKLDEKKNLKAELKSLNLDKMEKEEKEAIKKLQALWGNDQSEE